MGARAGVVSVLREAWPVGEKCEGERRASTCAGTPRSIGGKATDHHRAGQGLGGPKIALRGGDGMGARRRGGGGVQKWASVPGPLFCARTVVATKGAGTQIFTQKISPTYV